MRDAGIGGVEIQPPSIRSSSMTRTGSSRILLTCRNDFLEKVQFASQEAKRLGMRVDITLGSGWPFGGPHTTIDRRGRAPAVRESERAGWCDLAGAARY